MTLFARSVFLASAAALVLVLAGCATAAPSLPVDTAGLPRPIRVACVGDSITYGHLIPDREQQSYPSQLARLLGPGWEVGNFGRNGATMLRRGHRPYNAQPEYTAALAFRPHVVVLQLGTNDTKRETWETAGNDLVDDTIAMIRDFEALDTQPRVVVCLPIPIFRDRGKAWDTDKLLRETITPRIQEAARRAGVPTLDLYVVFAGQTAHLPDGVHPDVQGAALMARTVYTALTGKPVEDGTIRR